MTALTMTGLSGAEPLGLLAAVGVQVACVDGGLRDARLHWPREAGLAPVLVVDAAQDDVIALLGEDARRPLAERITGYAYPKVEKSGCRAFAGGAPPIGVLRAWVEEALDARDHGALAYLAAICCPAPGKVIKPEKVAKPEDLEAAQLSARGRLDRSAEPCFFDFTSRTAQFLDQARRIGALVDGERVARELLEARFEVEKGARRMGWDAWSGRPGALSGSDLPPSAPSHEWFAFRGLRQLPMAPDSRRSASTACEGRRKSGAFQWPLWTEPLTKAGVRTLLGLSLAEDWTHEARQARGIRDVFCAELAKVGGYDGTFAPSAPVPG